MKIGMTRERFQSQVRKALYEAGLNRNDQSKVTQELVRRGFNIGHVTDLFEENIRLDTDNLSIIDLGVIAMVIYDTLEIGYVDPSLYFTDIELEEIKQYQHIPDDKVKPLEFPIVYEKCHQKADNMWTTVVHVKDIARLYWSNIVRYNFDMQREAKRIAIKDSIILHPSVNWSSVSAMEKEMVQGTFFPNTITLNLRDMEYKYDANKDRLILTDGKLDIIDGFHRSLAMIGALRQKDIDYRFGIRFTDFDVDEARRFIIQEDKRNPISKEYIKQIDSTDFISNIVNNINRNGKSELRGLITTELTEIRDGRALVSHGIMYGAIKELWHPKTRIEVDVISKNIIDFFNYLVYLYPNEFKTHIRESRRLNQINDERMFILYVILAKMVEDERLDNSEISTAIELVIIDDKFKEYMERTPSSIKHAIGARVKDVQEIVEGVLGQ